MATKNGTNLDDTLKGGAAADKIYGFDGNDSLVGGGGNDTIEGGLGDDTLRGDAGSDKLRGGDGNDIYFYSTGDTITETASGGTADTVFSSVTLTLANNVENAILQGKNNINVTGNAGNNDLTGNAKVNLLNGKGGNDVLDGETGADSLLGGDGDDELIWDSKDAKVDGQGGTGDIVKVEVADQAFDLIAISNSKIKNIEIIEVTGAGSNSVTLNRAEVIALGSDAAAGQVTIRGNAGDTVVATDDWVKGANAGGYTTWTSVSPGATLLVQDGVVFTDSVNEAPVITSNGGDTNAAISIGENTTAVTTVVGTDEDTAADDLTYSIVAGADAGLFSINADSGALTFKAAPDFENPGDAGGDPNVYQVTVQVSDGVQTDTQAISVAVLNVNEAPVNTAPASDSVDEDGKLVFSVANGNAISVSDVDGAEVELSVTLTSTNGVMTLSGNEGLVMVEGGSTGSAKMVFTGTESDINAALEGLIYNPDADFNGAAKITITTNDQGNTGSGGALEDTDEVSITVNSVNDPPVLTVPGEQSTSLLDNLGIGMSVEDVDIGSDDITVELSTDLGSLSLGVTTGLEFAGGDGSKDASMEFSGSITDVNAALASLVYHATQAGSGTVSVSVGDEDEGSNEDTIDVSVSDNVQLSTLDSANGFELNGETATDRSGYSVSDAGDVNGDGFGDFLIGAWGRDINADYAGATYLVFGKASGFDANLDLADLDGTNGFEVNGEAERDYSGRSVSAAGDVNGDGYGDLLIGAQYADGSGNNVGASYVIFGKASDFSANFDLADLNGSNGFEMIGESDGDRAGFSVSAAGDVNGDGYDDLLIGADFRDVNGDNAGATYVVFGKASGFDPSFDLADLDGTNGFELNGEMANDRSGFSVSAAGDVNGDGYGDLLIGARGRDYNEADAGGGYVVFGKASGFAPNLDLFTIDGTNGFKLNGETASDRAGYSVSAAGDVNGDGYGDLIIGAKDRDINGTAAGASYVVFGKASGIPAQLDLSALDGTNGFELNGETAFDYSGRSVSAAGDVNGDGYDDLLIGAYLHDINGTNTGASYVVFGKASGFASQLDLSALDGTNGFELNGETAYDFAGRSVSAAGDVNGDGYDDLLIGAQSRDINGSLAGASYIVFGGDLQGEAAFEGGAGNDTFTGSSAAEIVIGGDGDDILTGGGGADVFHAGAGNDRIVVGAGNPLLVDGGGGMDTVVLDAQGASLRLGARAQGIEKVDLSGSNENTLVLTRGVVGNLSDLNKLLVKGDAEDTVTLGGSWAQGSDAINPLGETGTYTTWTSGGATVYVEAGVTVHDAVFELSSLDGTNGFKLNGAAADDYSGAAVSGAGDFDGDGFADVLIGAYNVNSGAGVSYVIYGGPGGFDPVIELADLTGTIGLALPGVAAGNQSGYAVSPAGDVNGDGVGDIIVGAPSANGNFSGASYVVFGASDFGASFPLSSLDGANGFRLAGTGGFDFSGRRVADAGDVNGDGFADVIIGAHKNDAGGAEAGAAYVVFGGNDAYLDALHGTTGFSLSSLDGANGFRMLGANAGDYAGRSVASAGDLNGDGIDDVAIGAPRSDPNAVNFAGTVHVVFGQEDGFAASLGLGALDGKNGFTVVGLQNNEYVGGAVAAAGDVNGDGIADLVIGASGYDSNRGTAYVLFGSTSGFASSINVNTLNGTNGFRIDAASDGTGLDGDQMGFTVSSAGDFNGDGYDDLLVTSRDAGDETGAAYVVFGSSSGFASVFDLSSLDGLNGFAIPGEAIDDFFGGSARGAGDVNGDGFDDIVIGAYFADPNGAYSGASYVLFGGNVTGTAGLMGTSESDTVTGASGTQAFHAGAGDDRIVLADTDFVRVDGGAGNDTLVLGGNGLELEWSRRLSGIERVDLGGNGNSLEISRLDVLNASSASNAMTIDGVAGNVVALDGSWERGADAGAYQSWTDGEAEVLVKSGITVELVVEPSAIITGAAAKDSSGSFVANAGDVNNDGFADVVIAAVGADPNGSYSGAAYVVFGSASGLAAETNLSSLDGTNGFRIPGLAANDRTGNSVAAAGDVNGDGIDDIIIGAYNADFNGSNSGASYVVFGTEGGFPANVNLATLDGTEGFRISGFDNGDGLGRGVSGAGDVNGDGIDDLVVGAWFANGGFSSYQGVTYVVFGATSFGANIDVSSLEGPNGFRLNGQHATLAGYSVSDAGDVNGDGIADLLVGAAGLYNAPSTAYVVFGSNGGFASGLDLTSLGADDGFRLISAEHSDNTGVSVSSAGDFNGDGIDDVIVGAFAASVNGTFSGAAYLVFGQASGFASTLELSGLDGTDGFRLEGAQFAAFAGASVSGAGDFNGDGYDDLIVSALGQGVPVFVNGVQAGNENQGAAYVLFGAASGFAASLNLEEIDAARGFRVEGVDPQDLVGSSVSAAGDVNGDGFDDVIVGARGDDTSVNYSGSTYILYGGVFNGQGEGNQTVTGGLGTDLLAGGQGDDVITGGGGADVLRGGAGNDRLVIGDDDFFDVDGGNGEDTLVFGGNGFPLDTRIVEIGTEKITGIEAIDIAADNAVGSVTFDYRTMLNFSDTSNTLRVYGNPNDFVDPGSGWDFTGLVEEEDTLFVELGQGSANLLVDISVDLNAGDFVGSGVDDDFTGGGDAELIVGREGADGLSGGGGGDAILAGAGADTVNGGLGVDQIHVGGDSDVDDVIYGDLGEGGDFIRGFVAADDRIVLKGGLATTLDDLGGGPGDGELLFVTDPVSFGLGSVEGVLLTDSPGDVDLTNLGSVADAINAATDVSSASMGDVLIAIHDEGDTGIYYYLDNAEDGIAHAGELTRIAIVHSALLTADNFALTQAA